MNTSPDRSIETLGSWSLVMPPRFAGIKPSVFATFRAMVQLEPPSTEYSTMIPLLKLFRRRLLFLSGVVVVYTAIRCWGLVGSWTTAGERASKLLFPDAVCRPVLAILIRFVGVVPVRIGAGNENSV